MKPHHELFVREYFKLGNGAAAYRKAFPGCDPVDTAKANAWQLIHGKKAPYVKRRIDELRAYMIKRSDITIERILNDLEAAKEMAIAQEKPNDMMNVAMSQAKVVGLLRDRVETGGPGDFEACETESAVYEQLASQVGNERALKLMTAMGDNNAPQADSEALEAAKPASDAVN